MSHPSSARWPTVFSAAVALATVAMSGTAALAQPGSMPRAEGLGTAGRPAAASVTLGYQSAFEGYRPFVDEQAVAWKAANETVHRRGGWQAPAREGTGPDASASASSTADPAPIGVSPGHVMSMPAMSGMPGTPATKDRP